MERYLFVIDYQNDFVDGALGFPGAEKLDEKIAAKVRTYGKGHVLFTRDTHFETYLTTREGKNLPVEHCIKGSKGWEIREDIAALLTEAKIYEKPTFGSTQLAFDLKERSEKEPLELELVGLCTDICVVSNALLLKAAMPEVRISAYAAGPMKLYFFGTFFSFRSESTPSRFATVRSSSAVSAFRC